MSDTIVSGSTAHMRMKDHWNSLPAELMKHASSLSCFKKTI